MYNDALSSHILAIKMVSSSYIRNMLKLHQRPTATITDAITANKIVCFLRSPTMIHYIQKLGFMVLIKWSKEYRINEYTSVYNY